MKDIIIILLGIYISARLILYPEELFIPDAHPLSHVFYIVQRFFGSRVLGLLFLIGVVFLWWDFIHQKREKENSTPTKVKRARSIREKTSKRRMSGNNRRTDTNKDQDQHALVVIFILALLFAGASAYFITYYFNPDATLVAIVYTVIMFFLVSAGGTIIESVVAIVVISIPAYFAFTRLPLITVSQDHFITGTLIGLGLGGSIGLLISVILSDLAHTHKRGRS